MTKDWIFLVGLAAVWATGDMLYKHATNISGSLSASKLPEILITGIGDLLKLRPSNAALFIGVFGMAMAIAFAANIGYSIPLSHLPVSVAKPALNGLTLAFVAIFGVIIFGESVTVPRVAGIVFVIVGIGLLSYST